MAKRFVDTELDDKEWFFNLPCRLKCAVGFLHRKCNAAGVWDPNYALAQAFVGENFTEHELLDIDAGKQFIKLQNGKLFIPGFIKFQYGKLSRDCKPHIPVYKLLEKNGIDIDSIEMSDVVGRNHNITFREREFVLKQDNYCCCYCGKIKEERNLVIDHVVPRKMGGDDSIKNLVACCGPCNLKKSDYSLREFCDLNRLDFETINKRVSERLSNRLFNNLQEKEKDKEKEEEKEDGGLGEDFVPVGIVPDMAEQFKSENDGYFFDQEIDFPILRQVARKIHKWKGLIGLYTDPENVKIIKLRWGEIIDHVKSDSHLSKYSLSQINKHFQSITQSLNSSLNGTHKQPTPASNRQQGANQLLDSLRKDLESSAGGGRNL